MLKENQEMNQKTPESKYELDTKLLFVSLLQQLLKENLINLVTYEKAAKEVK